MAKTPSDKLYRLIRSLTPLEKRYFKIFVRGKTDRDSKYLRLFVLIEGATDFDDEKFCKKIYKSQPQDGKKYPELKAYLYDLVLKSLQFFDEQRSTDARVGHLLQSVAVLFKRGFYDDCRESLHKAEKIAREFELFDRQLDILRWEKQLAYTRMDVDFLQKELANLHEQENRALQHLTDLTTARQAFFLTYANVKREAQHRNADASHLETAFEKQQRELFAKPAHELSHRAQVLRLRTQNLTFYAAMQTQPFYETGKQLIELLESKPHFLKENLSDYIASLSNLILSCGLLKKYDEVQQCLAKLRHLEPLTEDDRRKIHRQYYTNMFALSIFTGDFEEGRREMERHLQESASLNPHEYETASFYFQYCCICFGVGDFDGALDWLNRWLNQPRTVEREDLQSAARMLELALHFELNNQVLLESLVRSAPRFLQRKNRLFELEKCFIHGINDLLRVRNRREQKKIFQKTADAMRALAGQPGVEAFLQMLDLQSWLDAKAEGVTFAEKVREKAGVKSK